MGGWRVGEDGRLLSPSGEFVAMFRDGVILFYNRRAKTYEAFTLADWWRLMSAELDDAPAPPRDKRTSAGAWG